MIKMHLANLEFEIQQYISLRKDDLITVATDACIDTLPSTLPKERDQTSLGRLMPLSEYHSTLGFPPFPDFSTYPVGQKKGKKKREIVDCSLVMSVKERCNTDHPVRTSTEEQLKSSDAWLTQLKKRNAEDRSPNLSVGGFSYPEILASSTCRRAGRAFRVVKRGLDGDLQRFAQAPSTLLEGPDFTRICQEIRVIYKQRLHETHMNFLKLKNHLDGSTEKLTGVKSKINVDKACKLLKSQLLKLQAQLRTAELNLQKPRVKNQAINKHDFNLQLETIRHIDRQVKTMQDEIDLIQADPKFKP